MKEMKKATVPYGETEITLEHGKLAKQADGSVTVRQGDTVILATACVADAPKPGGDFFPMTVDYEERMYAAGKISSSKFMKREGKPSETAVLTGRLIDRSIRPMFPKSFRREVQIVVTTLSIDGEHDAAALAVIGASAALTQTDAPFEGPVAAVRVGMIDGKLILNPTTSQIAEGDLDLLASGTEHKITMIEVAANEIPEAKMAEALAFAQKAIALAIEPQRVFINKDKDKIEHVEPEHIGAVKDFAWDRLQEIVTELDLEKRHDMLKELEAEAIEKFAEQFEEGQVIEAIEMAFLKSIRALILEKKQRPDGR
ncbi:MAG: polyribonucleotide nucleotidyltransferase, partial [Patescibacteria group bacterium]